MASTGASNSLVQSGYPFRHQQLYVNPVVHLSPAQAPNNTDPAEEVLKPREMAGGGQVNRRTSPWLEESKGSTKPIPSAGMAQKRSLTTLNGNLTGRTGFLGDAGPRAFSNASMAEIKPLGPTNLIMFSREELSLLADTHRKGKELGRALEI